MDEPILPEPVMSNEKIEPPKPKKSKIRSPRTNSTLSILLVILLVAFIGLVSGVVYDYVHNHSQDNTRKKDLAYIANLAQNYYRFYGYYPTLSDFNSTSFAAIVPVGINKTDFKDPAGNSDLLLSAPSTSGYAYITSPAGCNNTTVKCQDFKLVAILNSNKQYTISSQRSG